MTTINNSTKINKILTDFGLSENEIKVYLEALNGDSYTPLQLSKFTGIPRTTVYDIIMTLSLKGLIELKQSDGLQKKQTLIKAKNPSVIRFILQEKRKDLTILELNVMDIIADLKKDYHKNVSNAFIKFYPGIEGAKELMKISSDIDLPSYCWSYLTPMDAFGSEALNEYVQDELSEMKPSKYRQKIIIPLNDWTKHVVTYQYSKNSDYIKIYEFRFIDNQALNIFPDIVMIGDITKILMAKDNEVWGLTITSKLLTQTFISLHQYMWESANPLTESIIESWGENEIVKAEKDRLINTK